MRDAFIGLSGLLLQIVVGFAPIFLFKMAVVSKTALGRLAGKIDASTKGLTNRAKEYGESRNFYQRRQMARDARKNEQRRANVSDYAERITGDNFRSRLLRRRAAGGLRGQVVGTLTGGRQEVNAAGQQRQYVSGLSQAEKQEHEEAQQAAFVLERNRVNTPLELAKIAAGGEATGLTGQTVDGAGNRAMQLAAIQKIIKAQDAEAIERMFMDRDGVVDKDMLVGELTKEQNYSTSKGAGAHFVKMQPRTYTPSEIHEEAVGALSALAAAKLATQDGPAVVSAVEGFKAGQGTLKQRQDFWDRAHEIYSNPQTLDSVKGSARKALDDIFGAPAPGGGAPTIKIARP